MKPLKTLGIPLLAILCVAAAPAPRPRVVMLSLDGADAATLHRLFREGKLGEGGFARFFAEGQVADHLVPVTPASTSPNHITMATGYPPSATGIVANDFVPPGKPLGATVSGFAAEIGTETLWEAARRQGLTVAISAWPGADNRSDRRRGDWGMTYTDNPDQKADLVTLSREDWRPAGLGEAATPVQIAGAGSIQVRALDSTNDDDPSYDGLRVAGLGTVLKAGQWGLAPCREGGRPACWIKVLEIDPALARVRLYIGGEYALHGYPERFEKELLDAGLVWPGPPDSRRLSSAWAGGPGIDLDTWVEQDERLSTFFLDALLATERSGAWDLLMGYTPVLDEAGHELLLVDPRQPGFTAARQKELDRARIRMWQSVDRELARLLAAVDLSRTTVLVVSDHGMVPVHTMLDLGLWLREKGLLVLDEHGRLDPTSTRVAAVSGGGFCHVYVRRNLPGREALIASLRDRLAAWTVGDEKPIARIFSRAEAAAIGLDHPNSGDLIVFARPGYYFRSSEDPVADAVATPARLYGKHGYLATEPAIQGIYLALGRGVTQGSAGTVLNTDIAARVAGWLGIEKPAEKPAPTPKKQAPGLH